MKELPVLKVDRVLELEQAVVDGVDISGRWNRMFSQRAITEYPTEALDWITSLDGGESLRNIMANAPGRVMMSQPPIRKRKKGPSRARKLLIHLMKYFRL